MHLSNPPLSNIYARSEIGLAEWNVGMLSSTLSWLLHILNDNSLIGPLKLEWLTRSRKISQRFGYEIGIKTSPSFPFRLQYWQRHVLYIYMDSFTLLSINVSVPISTEPFSSISSNLDTLFKLKQTLRECHKQTTRLNIRKYGLSQDLVKSRSHEIGTSNWRIAFKFDRHIGSNAAEVPVKFQSDRRILNTNLVASRLHEILR